MNVLAGILSEHEMLYLLGLILLILALLGFVRAWAERYRPRLALVLLLAAAAPIVFVALNRPGGLYPAQEIPLLTVTAVAHLLTLF